MAHCTQLCTTKKKFYSQQIKIFFLGITLFDTFSLLFQKKKNLMPLFLIACNRGLRPLEAIILPWTLMCITAMDGRSLNLHAWVCKYIILDGK